MKSEGAQKAERLTLKFGANEDISEHIGQIMFFSEIPRHKCVLFVADQLLWNFCEEVVGCRVGTADYGVVDGLPAFASYYPCLVPCFTQDTNARPIRAGKCD